MSPSHQCIGTDVPIWPGNHREPRGRARGSGGRRIAADQEKSAQPADCGVRRIHHVGITVRQLDRSLAFYRDLLGLAVIGLSDDEDVAAIVGLPGARIRAADLDAGNGQLIELLEYRSGSRGGPALRPDTAGSCHLSLQVSGLRSALSRLASAGYPPLGDPARLSGAGPWQGCTAAYLRDPDGVLLELIEAGGGG
jgi:catechol 2,3-dioxygenase-like lactoylglutathione lyase family enzyme